MGGQGGTYARQGQVGHPGAPNLPRRLRRHRPQSLVGGAAGQTIHKGPSARQRALERACAAKRRPNEAPGPWQRPLKPRPKLASRPTQAQEAQKLYVEEHRWSLAEREARPNQIRPDQLRRSPQAASIWKPINPQPQRYPARSGGRERRQRPGALRMLPSQRHLE